MNVEFNIFDLADSVFTCHRTNHLFVRQIQQAYVLRCLIKLDGLGNCRLSRSQRERVVKPPVRQGTLKHMFTVVAGWGIKVTARWESDEGEQVIYDEQSRECLFNDVSSGPTGKMATSVFWRPPRGELGGGGLRARENH